MFRKLWNLSVWHDVNLVHVPHRYRILYNTAAPLQYLAIVLYAAASVQLPSRVIDNVLGDVYGDLWSVALLVSGFIALVGVSFYNRMIWAEAASSVMVVTLFVVYIVCAAAGILIVPSVGFAQAVPVITVHMVMMGLPAWRVLDIVRELRPARELH